MIVFSDLFGTLLDRKDQGFAPAAPALAALKAAAAPLVLVSSKSLPDMLALRRRLGHGGAFIFENGGGVAVPARLVAGRLAGMKGYVREGGLWIRLFGPGRPELLKALDSIRRSIGAAVEEIGSMGLKALMARTGFSAAEAKRCTERRCSAPFFLADASSLPGLERAAARLGFRVSHGGRFYHLVGSADKGTAARTVLKLLGAGASAALGDSQTDEPLLRAVDRPYLVQREPGVWEPMRMKGLRRVPAPGPEGFRLAVDDLLGGTDRYL